MQILLLSKVTVSQVLVNTLTQAHNFDDRENPQRIKYFSWKNKKCDVSLLIPCIRSSLSRGHQAATINVEGQMDIVGFNCLGYSMELHELLMGNTLTCIQMSEHYQPG